MEYIKNMIFEGGGAVLYDKYLDKKKGSFSVSRSVEMIWKFIDMSVL